MNYWHEAIESSFDEHEIIATPEQIAAVAKDMRQARENYSMAYYQPESPYLAEIAELKKKLEIEREKRVCKSCSGTGTRVNHGPLHSSYGRCDECRGEGKR